jgi:hypothetical protein
MRKKKKKKKKEEEKERKGQYTQVWRSCRINKPSSMGQL